MNEPYHQEIEKWARHQRDHFHDIADDHNHPTARMIEHNIKSLEDAAQSGHSLRTLHDKMQTIEREVLQAQHANEPFMSVDHSVDMHRTFENKRIDIKQHPHFN